jgi:4-hydroxybenzoate polyprenyltransferase
LNGTSEKDFLDVFRLPQHRSRRERVSLIITVSSIFTALTLVALLYISFVLEGTSVSYFLLAAAFFLGVSVYSLNKVTDFDEDSINFPDRFRFAKKYRNYILILSLESINLAVVFAFFSDPYAILLILGIFYAGAFYSLGVSKLRVKKTLVAKNFMVAGAITMAAVLLPVVIHVSNLFIIVLVAYFVFLKAFINTVLLDVRDIEGDRKAGARTIPLYLGRQKTRNLLLLLNSTLIVWIGFSFLEGLFYPYHIVLVISLLYAYWYILRFTRANGDTNKYEDFLVDGETILLALYVLPFALGWPHF